MNFAQSANKLAKGFNSGVQATRERLGQVAPEDITELPQGTSLFRRCTCVVSHCAFQSTKTSRPALMHSVWPTFPYSSRITLTPAAVASDQFYTRITKAYESETYDYPVQIQESITELSTTIGHGITNFAATNLKGTNLPVPSPTAPPVAQHKTLPHALCRASTTAANALQSVPGGNSDKLGKALTIYAGAMGKVATARTEHDESVQRQYLQPWQTTLSTSINVAMKARQAVRVSRLELDAAKQVSVSPHVPLFQEY